MAPLRPHWARPSHPDVQEVIAADEAAFATRSVSRVAVPPFGLFARLAFPPCTVADRPTYATVQFGRDEHLDLNSDLLYINHSCEPSLIFDTGNLNVLAGPRGLRPGDELTFFYPSTEWHMAQPFDCLCGAPGCRGRIAGAQDMTPGQLEGLWLNGHIRALLDERDGGGRAPRAAAATTTAAGAPPGAPPADATAQALRDALLHAEKVVEAARAALASYAGTPHGGGQGARGPGPGPGPGASVGLVAGAARRGPTSRELSGEMGGDTICA